MGRPRKSETKKPRAEKAGAPQLKPFQWTPGQSGNPAGRPKKKVVTDVLSRLMGEVAPDEFYVNGFEGLLNAVSPGADIKKMSIGEMVAFRMVHAACTGAEHKGLKAAVEILNRLEGKIPLPLVAKVEEDDDYKAMTEEQVNAELQAMAIQMKTLEGEK